MLSDGSIAATYRSADQGLGQGSAASLLDSARRKTNLYMNSLPEARMNEMSSLKRLEDITVETQSALAQELERRELVHTIDALRGRAGSGNISLGGDEANADASSRRGLTFSQTSMCSNGGGIAYSPGRQYINSLPDSSANFTGGANLPYTPSFTVSSTSPSLSYNKSKQTTVRENIMQSDPEILDNLRSIQEENKHLLRELSAKTSECESLKTQLNSTTSINRQLNAIKDQLSAALGDSNGKLQFRQNQILEYERDRERVNIDASESSRTIVSLQSQIKLHKNELAISHAELRQAVARVTTLEKEMTELHGYGLNRERHQKVTEVAKLEAADTKHRELSRNIEVLSAQLQSLSEMSNLEKVNFNRRLMELENENMLLIGELKGTKIEAGNLSSKLEACNAQANASATIIKDLESINKLLLDKKVGGAPVDIVSDDAIFAFKTNSERVPSIISTSSKSINSGNNNNNSNNNNNNNNNNNDNNNNYNNSSSSSSSSNAYNYTNNNLLTANKTNNSASSNIIGATSQKLQNIPSSVPKKVSEKVPDNKHTSASAVAVGSINRINNNVISRNTNNSNGTPGIASSPAAVVAKGRLTKTVPQQVSIPSPATSKGEVLKSSKVVSSAGIPDKKDRNNNARTSNGTNTKSKLRSGGEELGDNSNCVTDSSNYVTDSNSINMHINNIHNSNNSKTNTSDILDILGMKSNDNIRSSNNGVAATNIKSIAVDRSTESIRSLSAPHRFDHAGDEGVENGINSTKKVTRIVSDNFSGKDIDSLGVESVNSNHSLRQSEESYDEEALVAVKTDIAIASTTSSSTTAASAAYSTPADITTAVTHATSNVIASKIKNSALSRNSVTNHYDNMEGRKVGVATLKLNVINKSSSSTSHAYNPKKVGNKIAKSGAIIAKSASSFSIAEPSSMLTVTTGDGRGFEEASGEPSTPKIVLNMTIPSLVVPFVTSDSEGASFSLTGPRSSKNVIDDTMANNNSDCDMSIYSLGNLSDTKPSANEKSSGRPVSNFANNNNTNTDSNHINTSSTAASQSKRVGSSKSSTRPSSSSNNSNIVSKSAPNRPSSAASSRGGSGSAINGGGGTADRAIASKRSSSLSNSAEFRKQAK